MPWPVCPKIILLPARNHRMFVRDQTGYFNGASARTGWHRRRVNMNGTRPSIAFDLVSAVCPKQLLPGPGYRCAIRLLPVGLCSWLTVGSLQSELKRAGGELRALARAPCGRRFVRRSISGSWGGRQNFSAPRGMCCWSPMILVLAKSAHRGDCFHALGYRLFQGEGI